MRTEAPMRRAAIAAHSAALPPPTTRTSTFEAAASLMIAFGRSCSTFPVHRYESDELIGRRTALSTAWAGPGFIGRRAPPPADRLSRTRLRDGVHHALVVPSFGASREVKRECGRARDRPGRCCPRNCRRIVLDQRRH